MPASPKAQVKILFRDDEEPATAALGLGLPPQLSHGASAAVTAAAAVSNRENSV